MLAVASEVLSNVVAVAAVLTALAALVGQWQGQRLTRRLFDHEFANASAGLLREITTGEVAEARNVTGTFRYGQDEEVSQLSLNKVVHAYYTLAWCVERVAMGYSALSHGGLSYLETTTLASISWHCKEILNNLAMIHVVLDMEDDQLWQSLQDRSRILRQPPLGTQRFDWDPVAFVEIERRVALLQP